MDKLGYTAMSAASRSMLALQVHAHNLANVNTTGFRADMERAAAQAVAGYGYDSRHLAVVQHTGVNLEPGTLMETGRALDVAVRGPGLIAVETPEGGEAYTRRGNFELDPMLGLTVSGHPVLGENGPIVLPEHDSLLVGGDGTISVIPRGENESVEVGRIKLVNPPAEQLVKRADGLLANTAGVAFDADETVMTVSGHLEASNVSALGELTATMSLNRLFEAQVKMMKAAEDLTSAGNRMIRGT